ncbi:hypothetical protein [Sulfuricurvum sp.]|uniref:hypothetical protein n=1 Tax=Sulfuricurvum sp. TaxID=2025608 RepID=UPI00286DF67E|nr:hypothetical protein [Sulfuricurvum sp.]
MIIEILKPEDVNRIVDTLLRDYLEYSLHRLPEGFDYYHHTHEYGYFCIVTEKEDLMGEKIVLSHWTLPSMGEEAFWERIELIEMQNNGENDDVVEILVRVDMDVTVSLILTEGILDEDLIERIEGFIYEK